MPLPNIFSDIDEISKKILGSLESVHNYLIDRGYSNLHLKEWSDAKSKSQTLWANLVIETYKNTDNQNSEQRYKYLIETWIPKFELLDQKIARLILEEDINFPNKALEQQIKFESNNSIDKAEKYKTQERKLINEYHKLLSDQIIFIDDNECSLSKARLKLEKEPQRSKRKQIWEAMTDAERLQYQSQEKIFLELLDSRKRQAVILGHQNYVEQIWTEEARSYSIQEAKSLLKDIQREFSCLQKEASKFEERYLGINKLKPWDLHLYPILEENQYPLVSDYPAIAQKTMESIDQNFGRIVNEIIINSDFDLEPRKNKIDGNILVYRLENNKPFILCNASGGISDLGTLFHELGHAIHLKISTSNQENLIWDYIGSHEVLEFYAFVFSYIGLMQYLKNESHNQKEYKIYKAAIGMSMLSRLRRINERLSLELWLYESSSTPKIHEIEEYYLSEIIQSPACWDDLEYIKKKQWLQPQLFEQSFYNIEYAIATIAALNFIEKYESEPDQYIQHLVSSMYMGGNQGTKAIFSKAGITFPFESSNVQSARDLIREWITPNVNMPLSYS